jgi:hypothetical protein
VFFFLLEGVITSDLMGPSVAYFADVLLDLGGMVLVFARLEFLRILRPFAPSPTHVQSIGFGFAQLCVIEGVNCKFQLLKLAGHP